MTESKPKMYVIQKKVMAISVPEALRKEPETPIESVFPDTAVGNDAKADAIGFKTVEAEHLYEV